VVYVDYDPVVLAHARALLTSSEAGATEYIEADLRDTPAILEQACQLLDFTRPAPLPAAPRSQPFHADLPATAAMRRIGRRSNR
jgi:hypothetical protein